MAPRHEQNAKRICFRQLLRTGSPPAWACVLPARRRPAVPSAATASRRALRLRQHKALNRGPSKGSTARQVLEEGLGLLAPATAGHNARHAGTPAV